MGDDGILPGLPRDLIVAAYNAAPGNEIASGKFLNPESSSALIANAFGFFLEEPRAMPVMPNWCLPSWTPLTVKLEAEVRFPWNGGTHPWLDVLIETENALVGIESKRYEPFRPRKQQSWSSAYWRGWGDAMQPYERIRDDLRDGLLKFERLDAAQLVKHAFGIRTRAHTEERHRGRKPVLYYLYAEPERWPEGRVIGADIHKQHVAEIEMFSERAMGAEVEFRKCSYRDLLSTWKNGDNKLAAHADAISNKFPV